MTQEQISKIHQARHLYTIVLPRNHKKELEAARKLLVKLESKCDHTYSNGKSAIIGGIFNKQCEICFYQAT